MFCTECGKQNPDNAKFCVSCGQQLAQTGRQQQYVDGAQRSQHVGTRRQHYVEHAAEQAEIPTYFGWSLFSTVLCCMPAGIIGLVYSNRATTELACGNLAAAREASDKAKKWNTVGLVLCLIFWAIMFLVGLAEGG